MEMYLCILYFIVGLAIGFLYCLVLFRRKIDALSKEGLRIFKEANETIKKSQKTFKEVEKLKEISNN